MKKKQFLGKHTGHLTGLDIFRVWAAFTILMFHSISYAGCNYGILQPFIKMGAIFMTGFFMLSGYTLFYSYQDKNFTNIKNITLFYGKRAVAILPVYYVIAMLYILLLGKETYLQNIILAPVEILGIQSMFSSLFSVSHNDGTWFISCIISCYAVFPYIHICVKQLDKKIKLLLIIIFASVLFYSPLVVEIFNTMWIYDNPFFRILEFMIGVFLASITLNIEKEYILTRILFNKIAIVIEVVVMVAGVTVAYYLNISRDNYMLYSWICLPAFSLILPGLAYTEWKYIGKSRVLAFFSKISYCFFLAQYFVWPIIGLIKINNNIICIFYIFILCTIIACIFYYCIELPSKKYFIEKLKIKELE